jgi:hypothetical protein
VSRAVRRIAPNGRISTFEQGRSLFANPFSTEAHTYYLVIRNKARGNGIGNPIYGQVRQQRVLAEAAFEVAPAVTPRPEFI